MELVIFLLFALILTGSVRKVIRTKIEYTKFVLDPVIIDAHTSILRATGTRELRKAYEELVLDAWDEEFTKGNEDENS